MDISEWLIRIGLTQSEVKLYTTLIKTGPTGVGRLIDESGVSRSKIYHVLERLTRKGLVTSILKAKTRKYSAADPGKLRTFLEGRMKEINTLEKEGEKIIPQIEAELAMAGRHEYAEIYKGLEGVKAARDLSLKVLKKGDTIYVFGSDKIAQDAMPYYWEVYHKKRIAKGIRGKYLMKEQSRRWLDQIKRKPGLIDIKYIDVKGPVYIDIFADYVVTSIMMPGYYMAFLIKNAPASEYYKEWFEMLWKEAKP